MIEEVQEFSEKSDEVQNVSEEDKREDVEQPSINELDADPFDDKEDKIECKSDQELPDLDQAEREE